MRLEALKEVGPSVFFSLLVIAVAFLPIFTLVDQEGRLFKPLAYSKNFAMAIAAILAITLDPVLRMLFTRVDYPTFKPRWLSWIYNRAFVGNYYAEEKHPVSRRLFKIYEPACRYVLARPKKTIRSRRSCFSPRSRLYTDRQRIHAASQRGHDPLHADYAARHLSDRGL